MPKLMVDSKPLNLKIISLVIVMLILLAGNLFFGMKYFAVQKELRQTQTALESQKTNEKVLDFSKLFIEKVLKGAEEISFEDRLNLENAARGLNDEEVLTQWNKFIESKTELEAQREVKNLLEMLVGKIKTQ